MQFKQFYLGCLAHASYLVGDDGECAIVDPQRDVDQYLEEAAARGLVIRHVIETHLHADFVSGHVELARRTGATIHVGHRAGAEYAHQPVSDGDEITLGAVTLRFLETPGHTPESVCVLVLEAGQPKKVLTGDTLFIGDVGRPDLVGSKGYSAEDMAGMMYDSLRTRLMPLPDAVEVYPAHGAGSACGRSMSSALSSTIGEQKALNWALQEMTREDFVRGQVDGLMPPPRYFPHSAELNRQGAPGLDELAAPAQLTPAELAALVDEGALPLDLRPAPAFGDGHVPGAVNIGLKGNFASWAGTLLDVEQRLVLVADEPAQLDEARLRLARVGLHRVEGVLKGGFKAWRVDGRPVEKLAQLGVDELRRRMDAHPGELTVLDVRRPAEHAAGHVPGAINVPVEQLEARLDELAPGRATAVICQTGYRSSAAASLLARHGFAHLANVAGGTAAWIEASHPTEEASSAATLS